MNIALVIERMDTSRGGRETSTAQIARSLVARGCNVTILCQEGCDIDGVHLLRVGRRGWSRSRRLANFVADVKAEMRHQRFDVVQAMLPVPGADVYQLRSGTIPGQRAGAIRRRCGLARPLAMATQPLNGGRRLLAKLEREVVLHSNAWCLGVSEMVARELADYYGRTDRVRVVYNAVDVPQASDAQRAEWRQRMRYRLGVKQEDTVFLTVAKNFELKGVRETIAAFARWFHHGFSGRSGRLVVMGRELVEGYQRMAGMREVGGATAFIPPSQNVYEWYSAADVCVLLSWYDPCSRVVLEATRWSVPSITTAFNGAAEVLGDGAGLVVDSPRDIRGVAAAMETLCDDDVGRGCVEACRAIAPRLAMDRHVDALMKVYEEVVRSR